MDLSFILVIAISAAATSLLMLHSELTRRRHSTFRLGFGVSYLFGLALMQRSLGTSAETVGSSMALLILMAVWVALGCLIGAVPTALLVSIGRWAAGLFKRGP